MSFSRRLSDGCDLSSDLLVLILRVLVRVRHCASVVHAVLRVRALTVTVRGLRVVGAVISVLVVAVAVWTSRVRLAVSALRILILVIVPVVRVLIVSLVAIIVSVTVSVPAVPIPVVTMGSRNGSYDCRNLLCVLPSVGP